MVEKEICYVGDLEKEKQEIETLENARRDGDGVSYSKGCGVWYTLACC